MRGRSCLFDGVIIIAPPDGHPVCLQQNHKSRQGEQLCSAAKNYGAVYGNQSDCSFLCEPEMKQSCYWLSLLPSLVSLLGLHSAGPIPLMPPGGFHKGGGAPHTFLTPPYVPSALATPPTSRGFGHGFHRLPKQLSNK